MIDATELSELSGTYQLSGVRSRKIAKLLLLFLPLFAFSTLAAVSKEDFGISMLFGAFFLVVGIVAVTLLLAKSKTTSLQITEDGLRIDPIGFRVSAADIKSIEVGQTPDGHDLFFVFLGTRHFLPYFGTAWCFGKVLAVNTEE